MTGQNHPAKVSINQLCHNLAYGTYLTSGNVYVALNSGEESRGTAMAVYSMFGNVSGIINPVVLGLIAENLGSRGALQFSTGMTLLGLVLVSYMAKKGEERTQ